MGHPCLCAPWGVPGHWHRRKICTGNTRCKSLISFVGCCIFRKKRKATRYSATELLNLRHLFTLFSHSCLAHFQCPSQMLEIQERLVGSKADWNRCACHRLSFPTGCVISEAVAKCDGFFSLLLMLDGILGKWFCFIKDFPDITLPKTNNSRLKVGHPKRKWIIFQALEFSEGELLLSGLGLGKVYKQIPWTYAVTLVKINVKKHDR